MTEKERIVLHRYANKNVSLTRLCDEFGINFSAANSYSRRHELKFAGPGIQWTDEMLNKLRKEFPAQFNKELAAELKVSWRTLVRKARELGIEKEAGFLKKNKEEILKMAVAGNHYTYTSPSENFLKHSFKKGERRHHHKIDYEALHEKRRKTIAMDKIRISFGMEPLTKLVKRG